MKNSYYKQIVSIVALLLLSSSLFLSGCTNNITPTDPQSPRPTTPPTQQLNPMTDFTVTYNYTDTGAVQLSANNLVLKVGQTLSLEPAPGLYKETRFTSSGENFFGDVMKQEVNEKDTVRTIFTAIKPGKGRLQVIPNAVETARAVDLWVTVE
ncbi:MAG: hypothetical protein H7X79_06680 [Sporomusaceae bacterium]|nr:hypothetical protein [Sporomusaceae bacterium]